MKAVVIFGTSAQALSITIARSNQVLPSNATVFVVFLHLHHGQEVPWTQLDMDTSHLLHLKSVVEEKKKGSLFIMSMIRSVFIYFPHDFCDQNEGFGDTFKIGLFSRFNAFCENKLKLRAVFFRKIVKPYLTSVKESRHIGRGEHKYIVFILIAWFLHCFF